MKNNLFYKNIVVLIVFTISAFIQCSTENQSDFKDLFICGETLSDINGNTYNTVLIGNQCWMAENLRTSTYSDGSELPNYPVQADWRTTDFGGWVNYANNSNYDELYGKIYNWFAVTDSRGICPTGWIVPSDEDWKILEKHIGMAESDADIIGWRGSDQNVGGKLRAPGTEYWESPNESASNDSGFSGLPSGLRYPDGRFVSLGRSAFFWTSSWYSISEAYGRAIVFSRGGVSRGIYRKDFGFSIRCILDQNSPD